MHILWGILISLVGLFMLISSIKKSEFIVYRFLIARSKVLWGENVHTFYLVVGIVLLLFGILVSTKII